MRRDTDQQNPTCAVCHGSLPKARMQLACSGCGCGLHPSCAARVERGPGWGNRAMYCAGCASNHPVEASASVTG